MRERLGLFAAIGAAAAVLAAALVGSLVAVLSSLVPAERAAVEQALRPQAGVIFMVWVLASVICGFAVTWLWGRYVHQPSRLAADTTVIATVNPSHRLTEQGPKPLRRLAASVNQLAERYQREQSDVAARIAEASADLEQERNRLAVLMSELSVAVLVCNGEGRILLYNSAARQLLDPQDGRAAAVGLGRSVFAVLDRNLVAYALEQAASPRGPQPVATVYGTRLLRVHIAPVAGTEAQPAASSGFVVTLQDMTRRAAGSQARDELIGSLTRAARSSLGAIRAAAENVLDYPDMATEQRVRFLEIIGEEATAMGRRLDDTVNASAGLLDDDALTADLSVTDLLETLSRALQSEGHTVDQPESPTDLWLHADGFAVQRAVVALAARLREEHGVEAVGLRVRGTGGLAELDLTWHGPPLEASVLEEWTSEPLTAGAVGTRTHQDVFAKHGGEIWSGVDDPATAGETQPGPTAYIRMMIPQAQPQDDMAAGRSPATTEPVSADALLATYDFSLLTPSAMADAWQDRALKDLTFTVFDTETTGLYPDQGDEIISIGAVRIVNRRLLRHETFDQLVDPQRSVPPASIAIHGIEPELLVGQPTIDVVLPAFGAFAEDTVLVGHNVAFDLQFLRKNRAHAGPLLTLPVLDTLLLSPAVHAEHDEHSLEAICARLGVRVIGRHSALGDALVTGEVFLKLIEEMIERGIRTLGEAHHASQQTYQAKVSEQLYVRA